MPVRYSYNSDLHTVEIVCHGTLNIGEIRQYFLDLAQDEGIPGGTVEMVDLNQVDDFSLSSTEVSDMPHAYRQANAARGIRATLLIGAGESSYGMGRMIQAYFHSYFPDHVFEIFRTREKAEERLKTLE